LYRSVRNEQRHQSAIFGVAATGIEVTLRTAEAVVLVK